MTISLLLLLYYSYLYNKKAKGVLHYAEQKSARIKHELETERKESMLKLKDELYRKRKDFDIDLKRERLDLDRLQNKLNDRVTLIDQRSLQIEDLKRELQQKEKNVLKMEDHVRAAEQKLKMMHLELVSKLEMVSCLSKEDARQMLIGNIEAEAQLVTQKWIQKTEDDAKQISKERARSIVLTAMHRYAADIVSVGSSGIIHLPNEEMKGRIIGKEGRNIKALEMATGMEFIIGDSADITISGFNPIRREIARRTLEKLVADGRINPTRIEEMVHQNEQEIDEIIQEMGKNAILEFNLQGIHSEIITLLGKLHFRTSYSQNVLIHCKEVAIFARMIAEELGMDGSIALRAGLLHDIGKAVTAEVEGPHALIGADIAKRCGENSIIVNAIGAHHEEIPFNSLYAIIIVIADTISAARPGARRETVTAYIKRLEKLEEIAYSFEGVKKAYALQAGREIRIIVEEASLTDEQAILLARAIAKRIEEEMSFPGQIKVNVIREVRSIEYAR
jgi:ribonuclease Y